MIKIFNKLLFFGPMSLGDSFVCSGMVHYYADRCDELHLPVKPQFFDTMQSLYKDHTHIKVIAMESSEEAIEAYIRENPMSRMKASQMVISRINKIDIIPLWDMQLYANYELPFNLRYDNFREPSVVDGASALREKLSGNQPYVLVHRYTQDHPQGIPIDIAGLRASWNYPPVKIIEITEGITNDMMQYLSLIKHAEEIHCVPSSFHCLVDSVKTNAKLFFHDVREKTSMCVNTPWNNNKWIMLTYPNRI